MGVLLKRYEAMPAEQFSAVLTPFSFHATYSPRAGTPDAREKDLRLRRIATAVIATQMPWLPPVLAEAGAYLVTVPGCLCYVLPSKPLAWVELPGLGPMVDALAERADAGDLH